jgi:death-on-curing protein
MKHHYPTLEEIIRIHESLIRIFGGEAGIRDLGALESALMRPQLGYYNNLIQEAAALMESLAMNHPFIDGNKRVAFFVTDTLLRMNDHYIDCLDQQTFKYFMELFESGNFQFSYLKKWLVEHTLSIE